MERILMHKNTPVVAIRVCGRKIVAASVLNRSLLPVGTDTEYQQPQPHLLSAWNAMKSIPDTRQEITSLKDVLPLEHALENGHMASLTDCYWMKNVGEEISWADINFHQNPFDCSRYRRTFDTPDLTTDGDLKKQWILHDNTPILLKFGNYGPHADGKNLFSANEVAASAIAKLMQLQTVEYFPVKLNDVEEMVCGCKNFIKNDREEFINANQIGKERKMSGVVLYQELSKLGFKKELNQMIVFDILIGNTDRHEKNFGIIRDAETLEIFKFAPLFDSGSCLGWNGTKEIKPFANTRKEQLELTGSFRMELPNLIEMVEILQVAYEDFQISEFCFQKAKRELKENYLFIINN